MNRGQIIPKDKDIPHKKYLVRVYVGRDDQGKRKYHSETVTGTISQARARLNEMLGKIATSSFVVPSKQSLAAYLDTWLTNKRDLEARTRRDYRDWMERRVIPFIGMKKLGKLTKLDIQTLYGSLSSDHKLSKRTITYIHSILRQALAAAVEEGMIAKNPCDGAQSAIPKTGGAKTHIKALTFEQTNEIIEKTKDEKHGWLWRLSLTTGIRPQEALALKWSDLVGNALTINRAIVRMPKGAWEVREFHTKRQSSRRKIMLSDETVAALLEHQKQQRVEMMKTGVRTEYMRSTKTGGFCSPRHGREDWKDMLKRHGFPDCRWYDARHTHLTHLLSSGVNAKAVAARAGQSNPTVLLNTYAHVLDEVAVESANIVERRLKEAQNARIDRAGSGLALAAGK